jgi:uncharacterized coiled-coil protein SlyX
VQHCHKLNERLDDLGAEVVALRTTVAELDEASTRWHNTLAAESRKLAAESRKQAKALEAHREVIDSLDRDRAGEPACCDTSRWSVATETQTRVRIAAGINAIAADEFGRIPKDLALQMCEDPNAGQPIYVDPPADARIAELEHRLGESRASADRLRDTIAELQEQSPARTEAACGGCARQGAHKRWCPEVVGEKAARLGRLAEEAESLGDRIGAYDPESANDCYRAEARLAVAARLARVER